MAAHRGNINGSIHQNKAEMQKSVLIQPTLSCAKWLIIDLLSVYFNYLRKPSNEWCDLWRGKLYNSQLKITFNQFYQIFAVCCFCFVFYVFRPVSLTSTLWQCSAKTMAQLRLQPHECVLVLKAITFASFTPSILELLILFQFSSTWKHLLSDRRNPYQHFPVNVTMSWGGKFTDFPEFQLLLPFTDRLQRG